MKIAAYTAVFDGYDEPKAPGGVDCFCFTERGEAYDGFETVQVERTEKDPRREARKYKLLPHRIFKDYDITVWFDGEVEWLLPVEDFVGEFIQEHGVEYDVVVKSHPDRGCLYDEAALCAKLRYDYPEVITRQTMRYHAEGFPTHDRLAWTNVVVRRQTEKVREFGELWWKELSGGSRRDQISFPYCVWKTGVKVNYIKPYNVWEKTFGHKKSERVIK